MSSNGTILILGLDGVKKQTSHIPENYSAEGILAGIKKSRDDANSAGWDADYFLFDHEDKELKNKIAKKLKEKTWDVICVGGGLRLFPPNTGLLEDVTNAAVTLVSPPPRLVFQSSPEGLLERLQYQYPEKF